ncbi:MAG: hypothetical protein V7638_3903 [Acidobacteriota bacterium]|jgi:hypothetical protein
MPTEILRNDKHVYTVDGQIVTGVTDCLHDLKNLERVPDENLKRARERGLYADEAIMLYVDDNLKEDTLDPVLVPFLVGWKKAVAHYGIKVIAYQLRVFHRTYRYAGTLDILADMTKRPSHIRGNGLIVIDLKCTYQIGDEVALQLSAYENAYNDELAAGRAATMLEPRAQHRLALQLIDDNGGDFVPHWFNEPTDFMVFVGCLYRHNWRIKHGHTIEHR